MNCRSCGAPVGGLVCPFCGTAAMPEVPIEHEMAVLDQYHRFLATAPLNSRVQFLRNGFMPRGEAALIEAGVRILSHLNPLGDEGKHSPNEDAAARLEAIVTRLRIASSSREGRVAAEELGAALRRYRWRRRMVWVCIGGLMFFVMLFGACGLALTE